MYFNVRSFQSKEQLWISYGQSLFLMRTKTTTTTRLLVGYTTILDCSIILQNYA